MRTRKHIIPVTTDTAKAQTDTIKEIKNLLIYIKLPIVVFTNTIVHKWAVMVMDCYAIITTSTMC